MNWLEHSVSHFWLSHGSAIMVDPQNLGLMLFSFGSSATTSAVQSNKFTISSLYNAIIQSAIPVNENKKNWKIKRLLKIKIFGWYLRRWIILTKDNLVKHNWLRSSQCVFSHHNETIKNLFIKCSFVRSIWSCIQVASDMYPPTSVANSFGKWIHGIDHRFRTLIKVGALDVIWSLWLCRNDKKNYDENYSLLQVIYRCTAILRSWCALQRVENRDLFMEIYT
jgi:hypothetical protein